MKLAYNVGAVVSFGLLGMMFGERAFGDPLVTAVEADIAAAEIAGAVTLVADKEGILHLVATGYADIEEEKEMTMDSLFWIASMTKPITGVAVMMLEEQGKLGLDDEVSKYLPEFAELKNEGGENVAVTIRQLMTHTAGLSELTRKEERSIQTLEELVPLVVAKPVKFPAGERWAYSQTGINTAARIVEVVSGQVFPEFLEEWLFAPLGMGNTTFYPTLEQQKRLASSYERNEEGTLKKVGIHHFEGIPLESRDRYPRANGGLFSTAKDYSRFLRMVLRGGELDGVRYLKPESVRKMSEISSGDVETGFTPGNAWGIGWCVVREPQGVTAGLSPMSFGHGGAFGTQGWIDPVAERVSILMIQRTNFGNGDASKVRGNFQDAAARIARVEKMVRSGPEWIVIGNDTKIECRESGLTKVTPGEDTVTFVNLNEGKDELKMTHLPLKNSIFGPPTNIAVTPDQSLAVIANSVAWVEKDGAWNAEPASQLHLVDLMSGKPVVVGSALAGEQPSGLSISRDGKKLLVANRAGQSVSLFGISGKEIHLLDTIEVGGEAAAIAFYPDGKRALVTKFAEHHVGQLQIRGAKLHYDASNDIPVGLWPYNLKITPSGKLAIVCNTGNKGLPDGQRDTLSLIDLESEVAHVCGVISVGDGPEGLAISADGKFAAVPLLNGSTDIFKGKWFHHENGEVVLYAIQGKRLRETSRVPCGAFPEGIAFSVDGSRLYVGNLDSNSLSVFSVTGGVLKQVGEEIALPGKPGSMGSALP